jgi:hypothetical protein
MITAPGLPSSELHCGRVAFNRRPHPSIKGYVSTCLHLLKVVAKREQVNAALSCSLMTSAMRFYSFRSIIQRFISNYNNPLMMYQTEGLMHTYIMHGVGRNGTAVPWLAAIGPAPRYVDIVCLMRQDADWSSVTSRTTLPEPSARYAVVPKQVRLGDSSIQFPY